MDFGRNRNHPSKIFATSQVPAALSFRNGLTDTYQIKFQLVLPNLPLFLKFVSSVRWPEEGFAACNLVWFSLAMAVNVIKEVLLPFRNFVLPVSLDCHCSSNTTIIKRLSVWTQPEENRATLFLLLQLRDCIQDSTAQNFFLNFISYGKHYVKKFTILSLFSILSIQIFSHAVRFMLLFCVINTSRDSKRTRKKCMSCFACTFGKKLIF